MAKKPGTVQERGTRDGQVAPPPEERLAARGTVVMRDESDEIIDDLKRQLSALQTELEAFQSEAADSGGKQPGRKPGRRGRAGLAEEFHAGFAPHLAQRLQVPAEELTQRLARLIEQVSDPDLKAELEQCRETAFFLSSTFHRIQDNHRLLTESLIAERVELYVAEFFEQVAGTLEQRGLVRPQVQFEEAAAEESRERMTASPAAAATVLSTLAELASGVFGGTARMTLARGTPSHLRLRVGTDRPWRGVEGDEVSNVVFRPGVRAASVVDVLYIEKLIELQGGRLSFYGEGGQVQGFEVSWPREAQ